MDLRNLPVDMGPDERVNERRSRIQKELGVELSNTALRKEQLGKADEKNCEQMFGAVPVPLGLAGPLNVHFSSSETFETYLPLATTEGALVASINRGCKATREAGGVYVSSTYVGITRSVALRAEDTEALEKEIRSLESSWKKAGEATSRHLKILSYDTLAKDDVLFLTLAGDTDEAMGMNMMTIAAQEIGEYLAREFGVEILTVAGNVDSDKKPSTLTKTRGRGFRVQAHCELPYEIVQKVLKTEVDAMVDTARAKLELGSELAGALSSNLHAANIISAIYIATGQDPAHVVEGSLADTRVEKTTNGLKMSVELPALLVGVRGGGIELPAQKQCLDLLLRETTTLKPSAQLAETIGAAVLAGELSLLAAQVSNTLAQAHRVRAR